MSRYLIIGQGLAGTILSMKFDEIGLEHFVVDDPSLSASSKVAAGLVNPVVLKRLKMVQEADTFMPQILPFYSKWETTLQTNFFERKPIAHIFHSQEEQNNWLEKSSNPPFEKYLSDVTLKTYDHLNSPFGLGLMDQTAWLKTDAFLSSYRSYLDKKGKLLPSQIETASIEKLKKEYAIDQIIDCTGHLFKKELQNDIFSPTRGELIIIKTNDLPNDYIFHSSVFILPLGDQLFKVGATYHWDNLEDKVSEDGKSKLVNGLEKVFTGQYNVLSHQAGVRPNTKDRKPILGRYKDKYVFNGLGSRGVLMAPYLSQIFINYLLKNEPIPSQYNINRFFTDQ